MLIDDIERARRQIAGFIHRTPLVRSRSLSVLSGADVHLKLENLQKTGSFKVRGAFTKLLSVRERAVIAASMGNHAQAVAFAAGTLGKRAVVVMPETAALVKQEATRGYGAEVILRGERLADALEHARSRADALFIHPYDDEAVIAGQGTLGLEIVEDLPDVGAVLVPVGGGGLIAGVAAAVKAHAPRAQVVGVQSRAATSASASLEEGRVVACAPGNTIADGIAVGCVGERTLALMAGRVDRMLAVGDDAIAGAILLLLERSKLVAEGAGAAPLAALLEHRGAFAGERVVLVVSGGNIDFTLIDRIILRGLIAGHRIGVFSVVVEDVAGSLHAVVGVIGAQRANILDVVHDRTAADVPIGRTRVVFTVETRGQDHLEGILRDLGGKGFAAVPGSGGAA